MIVNIGVPSGLHPDTQQLVKQFAEAMANKLHKAQKKHGYSNGWKTDSGWRRQCMTDLIAHLEKGDPVDVANYCAFMHYHGWQTSIRAVVTD